MNDNTIDSLRAALSHSPDNLPLRLLLAETLLASKRLEEAEVEFSLVLKSDKSPKTVLGLANVFYQSGRYSACNVLLESLLDQGEQNFETLILYTKALVQEKAIAKAVEIYQKALVLKPNYSDEMLDNALRISNVSEELETEETPDTRFLQKPKISFKDVGGMESVKNEIDLKIIKPLLHPDLYKAYGKKVGGGILLYGPPGCGKTYIAKATAGQVNAKFLSVGLSEVLDMWMGSSEKNLHQMFELARQNAPCVLFFDEIDALGASRSDMKQSIGRHIINQFLQEMDGAEHNNEGVLILGATNAPWHLDPAFRRPGRFDRIIFVPPPDEAARESILRIKLANKPVEAIDFPLLSKKTEYFSGADIDAIIDIAIELKLTAAFSDGVPKPISTNDLIAAIKKHKASTQEWFASAKNFALFANDTGLYDDILHYLKIKK